MRHERAVVWLKNAKCSFRLISREKKDILVEGAVCLPNTALRLVTPATLCDFAGLCRASSSDSSAASLASSLCFTVFVAALPSSPLYLFISPPPPPPLCVPLIFLYLLLYLQSSLCLSRFSKHFSLVLSGYR